MPRFVILTHDFPGWHWDFMLEQTLDLRTWRLLSDPSSSIEVGAEALPAHRAAYLEYEGPVSGNRGTVRRWDHGEYELLEDSTQRVVVQLNGTKLKGLATLRTSQESEGARGAPTRWTFQFTPADEGTPESGR